MSLIRLNPHTKDLGDGFTVRRVLPAQHARAVGPFVFFDHMGPVTFAPGKGLDVRPHPHIGLATLTYLFEGAIRHRDSLGVVQDIRPGAVNWMTAGRGIVHSERTPDEERARGHRVHGIQTWLALPLADEEMAPGFEHIPADRLPTLAFAGARLTVVAGDAYGQTAPVPVRSRTLYVVGDLDQGATLEVASDHEQRAVYAVTGAISVDGEPINPGEMMVVPPRPIEVHALEPSLIVMIGGDPLDLGSESAPDHPRHMRWNFVHSHQARIDAAVEAWAARDEQVFPPVPGETEFIPYP